MQNKLIIDTIRCKYKFERIVMVLEQKNDQK